MLHASVLGAMEGFHLYVALLASLALLLSVVIIAVRRRRLRARRRQLVRSRRREIARLKKRAMQRRGD